MSLTNSQKITLKTAILADPIYLALFNGGSSDNLFDLANLLNQIATPDFIVWKTSVYITDIMNQTGFDWSRVDNLTVGKARIWEWMTVLDIINPSLANVRAGIDAVWGGTQADQVVQTSIYTQSKRQATKVEKILAVGTGTIASPAIMGYEGSIDYQILQTLQ